MTILNSILGGGIDLVSYNGMDTLVEVLGYDDPYDGGGGFFLWVVNADLPTATIQLGGFFFDSTSLSGGKWVRKEFYEEVPFMNVKWWGAKGDNGTDDTAAIQNALDFYSPKLRSTSKKVLGFKEAFTLNIYPLPTILLHPIFNFIYRPLLSIYLRILLSFENNNSEIANELLVTDGNQERLGKNITANLFLPLLRVILSQRRIKNLDLKHCSSFSLTSLI